MLLMNIVLWVAVLAIGVGITVAAGGGAGIVVILIAILGFLLSLGQVAIVLDVTRQALSETSPTATTE